MQGKESKEVRIEKCFIDEPKRDQVQWPMPIILKQKQCQNFVRSIEDHLRSADQGHHQKLEKKPPGKNPVKILPCKDLAMSPVVLE